MATVALAGSLAQSTNNSAVTATGMTTANGDLLCAFGLATGQTGAGTFSDNSGNAWATVDSVLKNTSADVLAFGVCNGNDPGASATRTVTYTPGGSPTCTGAAVIAFKVTGLTRTGLGAVRTITGTKQVGKQANQASGTAPAPVLPAAALTGNPTVGGVANGVSPAGMTPPTNWTEAADIGYSTPAAGLEGVFRNSGFTGTTVTWGSNSTAAYCSMIVELDTSISPVIDDEAISVAWQWPEIRNVVIYSLWRRFAMYTLLMRSLKSRAV